MHAKVRSSASRRKPVSKAHLTSRWLHFRYVNVINIHKRGAHAYRCKARRTGKTGLDRAHDPWLCRVVAAGPRHLGLHHREWTNELLERRRHEPLARCRGADAQSRDLVAAVAVERQPGVRRIPQRDLATSRGGAAGVSRLPRAVAL